MLISPTMFRHSSPGGGGRKTAAGFENSGVYR